MRVRDKRADALLESANQHIKESTTWKRVDGVAQPPAIERSSTKALAHLALMLASAVVYALLDISDAIRSKE